MLSNKLVTLSGKKMKRILTLISLSVILASGCASSPITAVNESNKDSTGSFDGRWMGTITNTPPVQQSSGNVAYMKCGDLTGRSVGPFAVKDGEMVYFFQNKSRKTYVNSKGGFKLVMPVRAGGFSGGSETFTAKKDTLTIAGSLEKGEGYHASASSDFGGAGCTSSVSFKKG